MSAARTLLLAAAVIVGLTGATSLWPALTRSTRPRGLLQVALDHYAGAPRLKPFAAQVEEPEGDRRQRLFGIAEPQARKLLSACSIDAWKHVSTVRAPDDGDPKEGERLFHLWVCERSGGKLMAAELWRPHMGVDGVYFAACAPTACPSYPQAFPDIRAWLGDTFEPVAERPPQ